MPVAPAEDEPPEKEASLEELAAFLFWGLHFVKNLNKAPTAEEEL